MSFCKNCGAENNQGSKFCFRCGSLIGEEQPQADFNSVPQGTTQMDNSTPQGQPQGTTQMNYSTPQGQPQGTTQMDYSTPQQSSYAMPQGVAPQQPKEKKPVNKKLIMIIAIAVVVVIVAAVVAIVITKNIKHKKEIERKTIKLEDYIEITYDGYDTMGTAEAELDYDEFYEATLKAMGKSVENASDRAKAKAQAVYYGIKIELDKTEELSNGDEITVDADIEKEYVTSADVIIDFDSYTVEVEGLKELKKVNPFDSVKLVFSGIDGNVRVETELTSTENHVGDLYFSIDKRYDLSVGDTITVSIDDYYVTSYVNYYGIKLTETSMTYTIGEDDVDRYITKISDVSDDFLKTLQDTALEEIKSTYSYDYDAKLSDIKYAGMYITYTKEDYSANTENTMYVIYTAKITFTDDKVPSRTIYLPVKVGATIQCTDGTQKLEDTWGIGLKGRTYAEEVAWVSYSGYPDQETMFKELITDEVGEFDGYAYEVSDGLTDFNSKGTEDETKKTDEKETAVDETTEEEITEEETTEEETTEK